MPKCKVCLKVFPKLRFDTGRTAVCGRCVSMLNTRPAVAEGAQQRLGEMLQRGIVRTATAKMDEPEGWQRDRAQRELDDLDAATARALPTWLNRLLADPKNTGRDFKLLRAYRRHLLHFDRPNGWGYPSNWKEVAARVRTLDDYRCTACGRDERILDVHHIVYVYHFGTHRQENLATLCRPCHEAEHGRALDFGEGVGTDNLPLGEATFAEAVRLTGDAEKDNDACSLPALAEPASLSNATAPVCDPPVPSVPPIRLPPEQSAWCILACHSCRRSQRMFVVGDDAAITCVFCGMVFYPGKLALQRKSGW